MLLSGRDITKWRYSWLVVFILTPIEATGPSMEVGLNLGNFSFFCSLKLVSAIFYFCTTWWSFKNHEKCFLFHLKSSFRSRDIQIFVFPSPSIFLPAGHCFRRWIKINLGYYDVINCLNKNLITHFVWYLEKEKRYDIEALSLDRVLNKEDVMEKSCRKFAPEASPRPLFHFVK